MYLHLFLIANKAMSGAENEKEKAISEFHEQRMKALL